MTTQGTIIAATIASSSQSPQSTRVKEDVDGSPIAHILASSREYWQVNMSLLKCASDHEIKQKGITSGLQ
ncbi:hypothetical protein RvY_18907 [Ramazzottius varieornatus]|uniref:Uncharacterized protein n=1 Tax=Ramazzottius varieornatus TaxID=947166 RepID=A0A1D1W8W1_RAMVA|nr:hypothetical protein RvY_18907 [Ramazzottius varieornatus]